MFLNDFELFLRDVDLFLIVFGLILAYVDS